MTEYLKLDSPKLTFAEYWRISPGFGFVIAAVLKILRQRLPIRIAVAYPARVEPLAAEDVPEGVRRRMGPLIALCETAGLGFRFFYTESMISLDAEGYGAALSSFDGRVLATVLDSRDRQLPEPMTLVACYSRLADGRELSTVGHRQLMADPPATDAEYLPGEPVPRLLERHAERLTASGIPAWPFEPERLADELAANATRELDFHRQRGVYVPMSDRELAKLGDLVAAADSAGHADTRKRALSLRSLVVWVLIFALTVVGWNWLDSRRSAPESAPPAPVAPGMAAYVVHDCAAPRGPRIAPGSVAGRDFTIAGVFPGPEQAERAAGALRDAVASLEPAGSRGEVVVLDRVVLGRVAGDPESAGASFGRLLEGFDGHTMLEVPARGQEIKARFSWRPTATEKARALVAGLAEYLAAPGYFHLRPPWVPGAPLSPREASARRRFRALQSGAAEPVDVVDPDTEGVVDPPAVESAGAEPPDVELDRRYRVWSDRMGDFEALTAAGLELGQLLGQLELDAGGEPVDSAAAYVAHGEGPFAVAGGRLELPLLVFRDVAIGLPALLDHLCAQGVDEVRYDLASASEDGL